MQLFCCDDIPLKNSTNNYSGGEKLRISLVRAFNLGNIIIINSDLTSLDLKMKITVKENLRKLVDNCFGEVNQKYTVFIR